MTSSKSREVPEGLLQLGTLGPHRNWIGRLAWSPDGRFLATPSDSQVLVWDCGSLERVRELEGHSGVVKAAAWSRDGRRLATGGEDRVLRIWDTDSWELVEERALPQPISALVYSAAALWVASGHSVLILAEGHGALEPSAFETFQGRVTSVDCVEWRPAGKESPELLVAVSTILGELDVLRVPTGTVTHFQDRGDAIFSVAFSPRGGLLASGGSDGTVRLWDPNSASEAGRRLGELSSHGAAVRSISFSHDGALLASASLDDTVRLWKAESWRECALLPEPVSRSQVWFPAIAFDPSRSRLATLADDDRWVRLWSVLDPEDHSPPPPQRYLTAKVVLVGDSGVGKTALGQRLARGEFKEQPSSHGQHFWVIDALRATRSDDTECEVVLWDLAGQPDYRLVHTLFLDRVDVALIVFDPTEQDRPLKGVDYWLNALRSGTGRRCEVVLVAARTDRGVGTLTREEMDRYCESRRVRSFVETSALTGKGLDELTTALRDSLDWESRSPGPTSAAFTQVKQHVFTLRDKPALRNGSPLTDMSELMDRLQALGSMNRTGQGFNRTGLRQAIEELAVYGHITLLRGRDGQETVLTEPDLLGRLASSVVLYARASAKGLGALEERRFLEGRYDLPELEQLDEEDRRIMLDAVATTFLERNLCLRETLGIEETLLIFPALINVQKPVYEDGSIVEADTYVVSGPVDRVFAALVVLLGYARTISRVDQWNKGAQYEIESNGEVCGFRVVAEEEGKSEFVLYFDERTGVATRMMFQGLFETFLQRWDDVDFVRYPVITCQSCGVRLDRNVVVRRLRAGKPFAFCEECGAKVELPAGSNEGASTQPSGLVAAGARSARQRTVYERSLVGLKRWISTDSRDDLPSCYLSHVSGDAHHARWLRRFEMDLRNAEVRTIDRRSLDYREAIGGDGDGVEGPEFILLCGTPEYRRACGASGSLSEEWRWVSRHLTASGSSSRKVIPLLIEGTRESAFPDPIRAEEIVDLRADHQLLENLFDLAVTLHSLDAEKVEDLRNDVRRPRGGPSAPEGSDGRS